MPPSKPKHRAPAPPANRRLRVFAFDPSLAAQLDMADANIITIDVPWEPDLLAGPIGEYLEIIDRDPDGTIHPGIDLMHPHLLATDGLAPAVGDRQFHQQMVYGVMMATIRHFETALGRLAQWAPWPTASVDDPFVRRLRVSLHEIIEANAWYQRSTGSVYFGRFRSQASAPGTPVGGHVDSCLSHDIIAHETAHALLDGIAPHYLECSNPDVGAFHEAFSDIVALFRNFNCPEVLRSQLAKSGGDLSQATLLGSLAVQFGSALGMRGPLRQYIGRINPETGKWEKPPPDLKDYSRSNEPHARGAVLVAAIFGAYLTIYRARTADLIRLVSHATGVLSDGTPHPDLVNRLAAEAATAAKHILTICIRALDYCPPMDLTFADYLRAIITADVELVPNDTYGYRLAIIEAFRSHGIEPNDVDSLAVETLRWQDPAELLDAKDLRLFSDIDRRELQQRVHDWSTMKSRAMGFRIGQDLRSFLTVRIQRLALGPSATALEQLTGLLLHHDSEFQTVARTEAGLPAFSVSSVRSARRFSADGAYRADLIITLEQERYGFLNYDRQLQADHGEIPAAEGDFLFRAGCNVIVDLETAQPRYFVSKCIRSNKRLEKMRAWLNTCGGTGNLQMDVRGVHNSLKTP